jgi:hypothetical protein
MEEFKYYCEKCKYGTNLQQSIKQHNESEYHKTGIRTRKKKELLKEKVIFKCSDCNFESAIQNNYLTHKLNNHSTKEERKEQFKYYCDLCDFGVFTLSCFDQHKETIKHKYKLLNKNNNAVPIDV